ncbi:hypothetical protein BDZ94DRAFT_1255108 [Collybia nuda]|uniref:Uncharacterized protein n=1 Tax=Collybia nuda TaxID=64659 RepID=A0A9P5YA96_9AGAR|nr:hypothetical protein BDZ94DRAFT_1255108 [Collybia nuda]
MPVQDTHPQPSSSQYLEVPDFGSPSRHVVAHLREVTSSPSPLAQFLRDPTILELSRTRKSRTSSRSPQRERRSPSIMALALVEEERQANHLKALLRNASDRIEYEIRRADEADARAEYAEQYTKSVSARISEAETARRQAEAETEQANSENRRYQMQLESVERELKRLRDDVQRLEKDKEELEGSNLRAKETSRQYHTALQNFQAREEGKNEVRHLALERSYNEGQEEGWSLGHEEGFVEGREEGYEEGRRAGRKEGIQEGREQGRNKERRNALEAFDRFLNEEMNKYDDGRSERIRRWAESIYHCNSVVGSISSRR